MAARQGQLGQVPRSPRRRVAGAARVAWQTSRHTARSVVDLPLTFSGGDRAIAARARRRVRSLGLGDTGITVEAWRGELTLRGTLPADQAATLGTELTNVRGVRYVNNFLRP